MRCITPSSDRINFAPSKDQADSGFQPLLLGTLPAGSSPSGLAFDGANIWVVNQGSGDVTKLPGRTSH